MNHISTEPPSLSSLEIADAVSSCPLPSSSSSSPSYTARVSRTCVHPPTIICIRDPDSPDTTSASSTSLFQYSIHTAPLTLQRELLTIIPALATLHTTTTTLATQPLLILPTFQLSTTPLTTFTPETEREKNRLLEHFAGFARSLCHFLIGRGYFADYIDPCTGHPALSRGGGAVYSEVDGASALLRYRMEQAGCCSVVLHPQWGSACYPASCVTNARVEAVLEGLERVKRRWEVRDDQQQRGSEETVQDMQQQTSAESDSAIGGGNEESRSERRDEQQQHSLTEETHKQHDKFEEEKMMSGDEAEVAQRIIPVSTQTYDSE